MIGRTCTLRPYVQALLNGTDRENPSPEELHLLCPHISRYQVDCTLMRGINIALPPVRWAGRIFVAAYDIGYTDQDIPFLRVYQKTYDTGGCGTPLLFEEEALAFAYRFWPHEMMER